MLPSIRIAALIQIISECLIVLFAITVGSGCNDKGSDVHFVLPTGYEGIIVIKEDRENGIELKKRHDAYSIEVPQNGEVRLKSLDPLRGWHSTSAEFGDGKPVLWCFEGRRDVAPSTVILQEESMDSNGNNWYLIGPKEIIDYYIQNRYELDRIRRPGRMDWENIRGSQTQPGSKR